MNLMPTLARFVALFIACSIISPLNSFGEEDIFPEAYVRTSLPLSLLGTVNKSKRSTALIRNNRNGGVKSYIAGEVVDYVDGEAVKIVDVSHCTVLLERRGKIESLSCSITLTPNSGYGPQFDAPLVVPKAYSPLAKYRLMDADPQPKTAKKQTVRNGGKRVASRPAKRPVVNRSRFDGDIKKASEKHGVDPYLVKAVIKAESNFDPHAVSPKNAQGIMQLMPGTADDYGVEDPFNPADNIDGGVRVLRDLMDYFYGNKRLVLAAYNAGKGAVIKHGYQVPPYKETRQYVDRVLNYYSNVEF